VNADVPPSGSGQRQGSPAQRIDAACDRFEAAWRAGQGLRIEDELAGARESDRPALFRELLALELELRRGRGERPAPGAYRDRFPEQADAIDAAFEANSGRNLLFGLLAMQNNLVSREALLEALADWVTDKARPLGQVLRDRGALDDGRYALLKALVAEHLKAHEDDPDQSLAALSSLGSALRDLEQVGDEDVRAILARVATAAKGEDLGASRELLGSRFRIIRPHAEGGLVFLARKLALNSACG